MTIYRYSRCAEDPRSANGELIANDRGRRHVEDCDPEGLPRRCEIVAFGEPRLDLVITQDQRRDPRRTEGAVVGRVSVLR